MTNEIKEILDYFEEYIKDNDMHCSEPMLNWKDLKIVLDYITNLQREIDKLTAESTDWESKVYDLQERINKATDKLYCYGEVFDSKILQQFQKEMEDILQGEDK